MRIVNYASSCVNKLKASLNDDARVFIYNRHMFIVQATDIQIGTWIGEEGAEGSSRQCG